MNRFSKALAIVLSVAFSASAQAAVSANVRLNSVGFLPNNVKRASILGAAAGNFNVRRAGDNSIAFTAALSGAVANADTGESLRTADFTAFTETGSFYLDLSLGQSPTFQISPDVYNDPFWVTLMGFHGHRCGMAVSYTWKSQTFGHGACHLNAAYQDEIGGGHVIRDGRRGWHDAGDYGKYSINGAFATGMLLQAWEWHSSVLDQWALPIPEGGGAIPDYLDEVKWNLDWLLKMQAANGSVYHKISSYGFADFVRPENDAKELQFVRASSAATADFCAVMSMAARIYQPYDPGYAAQCLAAATAARNWLTSNPGELLVLPGNQLGTGAYEENPSPGDADHRVWAAAEYWQTTGNAAALADFEARMAADPDLVSTFWDWGEYLYGKRGPKNHGIFSYLLSSRPGRNAARVTALTNDLLAEANGIVAARNAHGYGRPLGTVYHWGSNGSVARQVMLLDAADQLSPSANYVNTALDALGHLFGRNMYARSFVTGVGHNPPLSPHDRASVSDGIVNPEPGHLVGGAEAGANDWADDEGDFRTNEIAINWDAGLAAALARFVTVPPPATPTPTPSPTPCFSTTALRRVNVGGAQQTTGGNTWSADQAYGAGGWGYTGGAVSTNGNAIAGTTDDVLYNTGRYGLTQYQFTVPNGSYRVQLHFAETYFNAAGMRVMSVTLEGQPAVTALDIYAGVGGSAALVLTRDTTVNDGILSLGFSATADTAEIRAIAVFPAVACPSTPTFTPSPNWTATPTRTRTASFTISPTLTPSASITPTPSLSPTPCGDSVVARINSGGTAFTDSLSQAWSADQAFTGGATAGVADPIAGTTDDILYQTERYGSPLAYAIPVPAAGSYQVRFLWAETFHTAAGDRIFSVTLEGAAAITNLDIFVAAGGGDRAYQLTRTVTVNDGVLNIAATASVDQAKFGAIEVLWQGPACASPTPTFTVAPPTFTATRTATRSPTPTSSSTRSPTPSSTGTPSASSTRSASPTPSSTVTLGAGSPTVSPTRSTSPTPSPSPTPSSTATLGAGSPTVSPTRSTSPTASLTASSTVTQTVTSTRSASPSSTSTRTSTPSITVTATDVPPGSSPTPTPSLSPTFSRTATPTQTGTATVTASSTRTHSASATSSPTATPAAVTATATPTAAPVTPSPSPTCPPAQFLGDVRVDVFLDENGNGVDDGEPRLNGLVLLGTAERSCGGPLAVSAFELPLPYIGSYAFRGEGGYPLSATVDLAGPGLPAAPVVTTSPYPGSVLVQGGAYIGMAQVSVISIGIRSSLSPTPTPSPSRTASPTSTPSASPTHSTSPTPSLTSTLGVNSPTVSPTVTPSSTAPAGVAGGPLIIEEAGWHPHPVRGPRVQLRFRLSGPADELRVRIYLPSMILASEQVLAGAWKPGWNSAQVDLLGLPAGLCYGVLEARQAGRRSLDPRTLRLLHLP